MTLTIEKTMKTLNELLDIDIKITWHDEHYGNPCIKFKIGDKEWVHSFDDHLSMIINMGFMRGVLEFINKVRKDAN